MAVGCSLLFHRLGWICIHRPSADPEVYGLPTVDLIPRHRFRLFFRMCQAMMVVTKLSKIKKTTRMPLLEHFLIRRRTQQGMTSQALHTNTPVYALLLVLKFVILFRITLNNHFRHF